MPDAPDIIVIESQGDSDRLSCDDAITILNNNRDRIRVLGNMVLVIDGLLFSSLFVVISFGLSSQGSQGSRWAIWLTVIGVVSVLLSMLFGMLSAVMPPPVARQTKLHLVAVYTKLYHREFRYARLSIVALFTSVVLFLAAMLLLVGANV